MFRFKGTDEIVWLEPANHLFIQHETQIIANLNEENVLQPPITFTFYVLLF